MGIPNRDLLTVPPGIRIAPSSIPGAGMGAFTNTFLPRHTWLGEFQGEYIHLDQKQDPEDLHYAWQVLL